MSKKDALNRLGATSGLGTPGAAMMEAMRGPNHTGGPSSVPGNYDDQGWTFFTRPHLNLSYGNIEADRLMSHFLAPGTRHMAGAIRCILSPAVPGFPSEFSVAGVDLTPRLERSEVHNEKYAFIPIFANALVSLSGWPDSQLDTYRTPEGLRKETTGWVDGSVSYNGDFSLAATFQNMEGDPITPMLVAWMRYMTNVGLGVQVPFSKFIPTNAIDYNTRIYRFIMDRTRTYIRKWADVGAAYPDAANDGAAFNYNNSKAGTSDTDQVTTRFQCFGCRKNDPRTLISFNTTVETFNPDMRDGVRQHLMVKLTPGERILYKSEGYPHISETNEMEWWIDASLYASKTSYMAGEISSLLG